MNNNIITAVFGAMRETKVRPRYRYDQGQMLVIRGVRNLPDFYEVHFTNAGSTADATVMIGTPDGVNIPNSMFESGSAILCYIYVHDEATDGTTVYKVTIPIINRARPADVEPTPEQEDIIAQAIVALNTGVEAAENAAQAAQEAAESIESIPDGGQTGQVLAKTSDEDYAVGWVDQSGGGSGTSNYNDLTNKPRINGVTLSGDKCLSDLGAASIDDVAESVDAALQEAKDSGEFDGPQGPKGDPGADGADGVDGNGIASIAKTGTVGNVDTYTITFTNGATSTFTVTNGSDGAAGADGADGADGSDGADGVSPTVTVTDITGGHRVTVTDANGTRSFDVMDGATGQKGDKGDPGEVTQAELDALETELKSEIGDLSDLDTTAKTNLVAAINEAAQSGGGSVDLYYVTPEQYGAVGDGVTDDSEAVQDACDAGYAVYFASGKTYYLASTVTIDHDCHLFGGEGATIKTKTPTGGTAPNGIVVTGTLKKTTTMTSDYASTGTGDNGGNQWTLTDMTGIEIGDILIVTATDQYYSYSRQYYYLGATLLVSDIYNGHLYTSNSMPWDITNSANVTVQVYSAPTAIIERLNFVSDLDSRGSYIYMLTYRRCKNSVVQNCDFTQMDNGVLLENCVNTLVDCISLSKSKYDNALPHDGYGLYIGSCSNTVIRRLMSMCAQSCVDLSGTIPNIDTYIKECNIASECRPIGLGLHENSYNLVVEDCVLAGLSLFGTAKISRCRFIRTNRVSSDAAISMHGSHDPRWAKYIVRECEIDGTLLVNVVPPSPQDGIQAFNNIIGDIEINDCTGGRFVWRPATDSTILSNTIQRLIMHNWRNCYDLYLNGSAIDYAEIIDCTFIPANGIWINTNNVFGFTGIGTLVRRGSYPQTDKIFANIPQTGMNYYLPQGTPITFASNDTSAHYQVCGRNVISNDVSDFSVGSVGGTAGNDFSRTENPAFATTLSVNTNGDLVFTQPNNTNKVGIYSKCMLYINQDGYITMSCKIKNTGNTSGAEFYPYIAIVNPQTGKVRYRSNGAAQTATSDGVIITHYREVYAGEIVLCYISLKTPVANSETTLSEYVAEYHPYEDGNSAVYKPYVGSSRTGDGTLYSVSGYNNIMIDASSAAGATFIVDYLDNPLGSVPSAAGVSF